MNPILNSEIITDFLASNVTSMIFSCYCVLIISPLDESQIVLL